jgi:ribonuclease P protein component, eubacterial
VFPIFPLKKKAVFKAVLSRGQKWITKSFIVRALPNADLQVGIAQQFTQAELSKTFYGLIASKKVGQAVGRNKAKRRLREALRHNAEIRLRPGYSYVFVARAGLVQYPFETLKTDMSWALRSLIKVNQEYATDKTAPDGAQSTS